MTRALFFILIIFSVFLFGCNKTKDTGKNTAENTEQQTDNDVDTTDMTPAEAFASALVQDILNVENELELEDFLIDNIYPKLSGSQKVTIDRISSSLFLLKYYEGTTEKNILIQKFYNPKEDEIYFESTETSTNNLKQFLK
jgi:hypothetical protein